MKYKNQITKNLSSKIGASKEGDVAEQEEGNNTSIL